MYIRTRTGTEHTSGSVSASIHDKDLRVVAVVPMFAHFCVYTPFLIAAMYRYPLYPCGDSISPSQRCRIRINLQAV